MRPVSMDKSGVAIPLVMVLAIFLVVVITPFLLLSGSQTRSMGVEGDFSAARQLALSGLQVAGDRLRAGRWYGETEVMGSFDGSSLLTEGTGTFQVFCEDTRVFSTYERAGFESFPLLHHVDVFSRGESGGRSVVGYGAFIMNPPPELAGTSTDGYGSGVWPDSTSTPDTLKRMVRITYFVEPHLQAIEGAAVRDAIRSEMKTRSAEYIANYAEVDWTARLTPPAAPPDRISDAQAGEFLERFVGTPPEAPEAAFLRDRIFDMVLEGTPADQRHLAAGLREISIRNNEEGEGKRAEAKHFCELVGDCEWGPFPPPEERLIPPPYAVETLHQLRGAALDADYRQRLSSLACSQLVYLWGAEHTHTVTEMSEPEIQATYPGASYDLWGDVWWVNYYARKDENPCISQDYSLDDAASGLDLKLKFVFGFFRKYYDVEGAEPLGDLSVDKTDMSSLGYDKSNKPVIPSELGTLGENEGGGGGDAVHYRKAF